MIFLLRKSGSEKSSYDFFLPTTNSAQTNERVKDKPNAKYIHNIFEKLLEIIKGSQDNVEHNFWKKYVLAGIKGSTEVIRPLKNKQ